MRSFEELPQAMQNEEVRRYYVDLRKRGFSLFVKRGFDIALSLSLAVFLSPVMLAIALIVLSDSPGPAIFRQKRLTRYMESFEIYKFRTMRHTEEASGPQITLSEDSRVTKAGKTLRRWRLDELPQLFNILKGEMSFVGTRPEVPKYIESYTEEMMATFLLPAGLTSLATINFKDEDAMLAGTADPEEEYTRTILPAKMKQNLAYLQSYHFTRDLSILAHTALAMARQARTK